MEDVLELFFALKGTAFAVSGIVGPDDLSWDTSVPGRRHSEAIDASGGGAEIVVSYVSE